MVSEADQVNEALDLAAKRADYIVDHLKENGIEVSGMTEIYMRGVLRFEFMQQNSFGARRGINAMAETTVKIIKGGK